MEDFLLPLPACSGTCNGHFSSADVSGYASVYLHTEGFSGPSPGDGAMGKSVPVHPTKPSKLEPAWEGRKEECLPSQKSLWTG